MTDALKERDWDQLVYSLGQGTCVLLLGPGADTVLADGTRCNLSESLARQLSEELDAKPPATANLSHVAQRYLRSEGRNYLEGSVVRFFEKHGVSTHEDPVFSQLAKLPFRLVLTTRHDHTLDVYLKAAGKKPAVHSFDIRGSNNAYLEQGTVEAPLVYYLAGDLAEPSSLVLTEEDIVRFLMAVVSRDPEIPSSIRSEFQKRGTMFLLVGFGIQRWDTRLLFSVLGAEASESRSFAVAEFKAFSRAADREAAHFFKEEFKINTIFSEGDQLLTTLSERWEKEGHLKPDGEPIAPVPPSAARVFISYVQEDLEKAESLFHTMRNKGLDPFWDKEGIRGGDNWDAVLRQEVSEADYFVLLQSQNLAERDFSYVNKEITIALDKQSQTSREKKVRFIFPLLLDDSPPITILGDIQSIDAKNSEQISAIVTDIARDFQRRARR